MQYAYFFRQQALHASGRSQVRMYKNRYLGETQYKCFLKPIVTMLKDHSASIGTVMLPDTWIPPLKPGVVLFHSDLYSSGRGLFSVGLIHRRSKWRLSLMSLQSCRELCWSRSQLLLYLYISSSNHLAKLASTKFCFAQLAVSLLLKGEGSYARLLGPYKCRPDSPVV